MQGAEAAKSSGFAENQQLITRIARAVATEFVTGSDFEYLIERKDLEQAGMIGLLQAEQKFDPEKGSWIPFASMRIRGEMVDRLRRLVMVSLPRKKYERVKELRAAATALQQAGKEVTLTALARHLGRPLAEITEADALRVRMQSLDCPVNDEKDSGCCRVDLLPARVSGPEQQAAELELAALIQECLSGLTSDVERIILHARFLPQERGCRQEPGLRELAGMLGVTPQRVHQLQKKAMQGMKQCFSSKGVLLRDLL
jgi:RNA polymerase sigma factor for flagellar operon FliA